jgi:hypothetical protein
MDFTRHVGRGPGESGEVVRCVVSDRPCVSAPWLGLDYSPLAA